MSSPADKKAVSITRRSNQTMDSIDDRIHFLRTRRPLTVQECAEMHRCKKHPPRRATLLFVDGKQTLVGDPYKH